MRKTAALLLIIAAITGCNTKDPDNYRASLTLAGAIVGGFIGYQFLASGTTSQIILGLGGAAGGAAAGYFGADYITKWDRERMEKAAYKSLTTVPEGEAVGWSSPETGAKGSFTVIKSYTSDKGRFCREIEAKYSGLVNGAPKDVSQTQTACELHNGAWEIG